MKLAEIEKLIEAGQVVEALKRMQLALAGELSPSDRFALEVKIGDTLSWFVTDAQAGLRHYQEALTVGLAHRLPGLYRAHLGMGQALHALGRGEEAMTHLEEAATQAAAVRDQRVWAASLALEANIVMELGEDVEAVRLMELVAQVASDEGEQHLRTQAMATLALLNGRLGKFEQAEEYGRVAIALAKEIGDVGLLAVGYLRMGQVMYQQERYGPAFYWFKAGQEVAQEAGLDHLVSVLAEAAAATGVTPNPE